MGRGHRAKVRFEAKRVSGEAGLAMIRFEMERLRGDIYGELTGRW